MGLMCTKSKSHMSGLMLLYGHPVGPGMATGLLSFNDPHAVVPLRLVLVLKYLVSPSLRAVNTPVSRHDNFFLVYLLDPAINQYLEGILCNFGVQYK